MTAGIALPATASARSAPASHSTRAGIGIRLVDVPVAERRDPRALIYIVGHLSPGTAVERRIEISNTAASRTHVTLYAAAATIARGTFVAAAGHSSNDVSTWTSIRPGTANLPANSRSIATVTVTVPRDAAPGEQYGVVWAEARSAPVGGVGITEIDRVGIRLYLSIGPGGPPASNFAIESLTARRASNGRPSVLAAVQNTGGRALDLSGTLQLSDGPGRLRAGPFPATLGVTLGVGDTEPVTIALDRQLPAGPWLAQITLRSGLVVRSAQATITFPNAGTSAPVKTTSNRDGWPALTIAGIGALLLVTSRQLITLRRRRHRRQPADVVP